MALAKARGLAPTQVVVHAFTDGRDTSPHGGRGYLAELEQAMAAIGVGRVGTVSGRYFAMDRDRRWERTRQAYDAIVHGIGDRAESAEEALSRAYAAGITDEFVPPTVIDDGSGPATIRPGDTAIFFNFRADRGRQLTEALVREDFAGWERGPRVPDLHLVTMTRYEEGLPVVVAFAPMDVTNPLARVISDAGMTQFHAAETEKYPHVTFFLNGGREEPFPGEDRVLVPSPKVATYDLQPEMSAPAVTDAVVAAIQSGIYDFIIVNFANGDMVGHTGVYAAAVRAIETVDACLARVIAATLAMGGVALVTADHGNAEEMIDRETGAPMTAHTTNPVPVVLVAPEGCRWRHISLRQDGRLAAVAPTVLQLLDLAPPEAMTEPSLLDPIHDPEVNAARMEHGMRSFARAGCAAGADRGWILEGPVTMTTPFRTRCLSFALALGLAGFGVPALTVAQEATPGAAPMMEMPPPPEWAEVVATGLANPRGLAIGADGALYIAEAGVGGEGPCAMGPEGNEECFGESGGVTKVADGAQERVLDGLASKAAAGGMNATGPNDVSLAGDTLYVLMGLGGDPATRVDVDAGADQFGFLFKADGDGVTPVVDVAGFETAANPDGNALDANPFGLLAAEDGTALIVDAGMNALVEVDPEGQIATLATFANTNAQAPDGSEIPMNAVPTSVAIAADGSFYVGQLTGFPFPVGGANVFTVPAGGGEPTVAFDGFTNIIDIAMAPDGSLYVLEFLKGGMLSADPANPATLQGQLSRIAADGTRTVVAGEGLIAPTGLAVDADGNVYVAVFGVVGTMGQVWKIAPAA